MIDQGHPLAAGLIGCYLMDSNPPVNVADGAVAGSSASITISPRGIKTSGGSGSYCSLPVSGNAMTGAVSAVIRLQINTVGTTAPILAKSLEANPITLNFRRNSTGALALTRGDFNGSSTWNGPIVSLGAWHTIGFSAPATMASGLPARFLLDGAMSAGTWSGSARGVGSNSALVKIGATTFSTNYVGAEYAALMIYARQLSDTEMLQLGDMLTGWS